MERTFVMFKPDCLERGLVGRILSRFEEKGLRLVAMKMLRITPALATQHYAEHVEKPVYPSRHRRWWARFSRGRKWSAWSVRCSARRAD